MKNIRISYNAPVVLTFSLICIGVYFLNYTFWGDLDQNTNSLMGNYFVLPGRWDWSEWRNYVRLFTYTMGHANQAHIWGNLSIFLLIAPIMEEKYGSKNILTMMVLATIITAFFQILLFDSNLVGASGLVFMFIVLVSFADVREGSIPLTFILVLLFFIGKEVFAGMTADDNISHYAHIAGGILGAIFGFAAEPQKSKA